MRFYLDEHISKAIANGLRQRGHDVETVQEAKNIGKSDREQIVYAAQKEMIIVTADSYFLAIVNKEKMNHPGIIFITGQDIMLGEVIRRIDIISTFLSQENMKNHIEFV